MAVAFFAIAIASGRLHGPLFDSCEPDCSPEYVVHSDLRIRAAGFLIYVNAVVLPMSAVMAGVAVIFWRPLRGRAGLVLLGVLVALLLLDGWLMRYW